eukprot:CFRG7744T1
MKFHSTALLSLASLVAGSEFCNPLFKIFENSTGFEYDDVALSVYGNQNPDTLSVEEGRFRCPNVEKSCCTNSAMDAIAVDYTRARNKIIQTADVFQKMLDELAID